MLIIKNKIGYRIDKFKEWFGFFKFRFIRFFNRYYQSGKDDIKEITLYFENLDDVTIPRQYIGSFYLGKFERSIARRGCNWIGESIWVDKFFIEIHADANQEQYSRNFGKRYPFNRLMEYQDITNIEIIYKTGKKEKYGVNYDEGDDEGKLGANNILQQSKLNSFGDLYITIGKDTRINDICTNEEMGDEDFRDLQWDMYS